MLVKCATDVRNTVPDKEIVINLRRSGLVLNSSAITKKAINITIAPITVMDSHSVNAKLVCVIRNNIIDMKYAISPIIPEIAALLRFTFKFNHHLYCT